MANPPETGDPFGVADRLITLRSLEHVAEGMLHQSATEAPGALSTRVGRAVRAPDISHSTAAEG